MSAAPPTVYETARLLLRHFSADDVDAFAPIMADPEVTRFHHKGPIGKEEAAAMIQRFIARYRRDGSGPYAMVRKEGARLIGLCGLSLQPVEGKGELEVGYLLDRPHWGLGLGTEAVVGARDHAFGTMGAKRLVSIIQPGNDPSIRIAAKVGMHLEKEFEFWGRSSLLYVMSETDWMKISRK